MVSTRSSTHKTPERSHGDKRGDLFDSEGVNGSQLRAQKRRRLGESMSTPQSIEFAAKGKEALPTTPQLPKRVTSIISSSIDTSTRRPRSWPLKLQDMLLLPISTELTDTDGEDEALSKRKLAVDRDNIKINKRIMSKDTSDVIRIFKKFDDEVLTNLAAKARLLLLGFETRKRYITTFKHFIRFCCSKGMDNFFVTGELMREFYEEQLGRSRSNKPVIRLRKMDPAFSKLQEINFLVYNLQSKEIPNRHVAVNYLLELENGPKVASKARAEVSEKEGNHPTLVVSQAQSNFTRKYNSIAKITKNAAVLKLVQSIRDDFNAALEVISAEQKLVKHVEVEHSGWPTRIPPPTDEPIQIIDLNHEIDTVRDIVKEWYVTAPTVETRVAKWGLNWIRDEIDYDTFHERERIVKLVINISQETDEDKLTVTDWCDEYIREKLLLEEFVGEIEVDYEGVHNLLLQGTYKNA